MYVTVFDKYPPIVYFLVKLVNQKPFTIPSRNKKTKKTKQKKRTKYEQKTNEKRTTTANKRTKRTKRQNVLLATNTWNCKYPQLLLHMQEMVGGAE
jgi:hypothetical protein